MSSLTDTTFSHKKVMRPPLKIEIWGDRRNKFLSPQPQDQVYADVQTALVFHMFSTVLCIRNGKALFLCAAMLQST